MRQHARNSSRIADAASRISDDEGTKTAVKVGMYTAWHHMARDDDDDGDGDDDDDTLVRCTDCFTN